MAEFLSLQEGKVYRPATSRLANGWNQRETSFKKKIEKLIALNMLKPIPT